MAIITASNIRKSFGTQDLFEDVSFSINERERIALVGANGTGKTTLLRIVCEETSADSGSVTRESGITLGYLPQEVDLSDAATLHLAVLGVKPEILECGAQLVELEARMATASGDEARELGHNYSEISHRFDSLGGFGYEIQAKAILLGLGFQESELNIPVQALSGGQKTRAALARLLLLSPDLLLLDEPTNHLDIQACDWLQSFLQERYQGAALIVSHDRYFLDHVVSRVIEIENHAISEYTGNYSAYAAQKAERIEEMRKLYKLQQKEISRIETAVQTLFSDRKFSRRDNKIKQLQRISRISRPDEQRSIKANLTSASRSSREVVRLAGLAKSFPGKPLFSGVDFLVERGRKIGIVGPNGSGKTTLLRIVADRIQPDEGEVVFGHNVDAVYFAQEFDHLVPSRTVIEELLSEADLTSKEARDILAQFLFMGDDAFKKVEVLSGGEQCRLALAKVLADKPNLLLLDEPTNHLDIRSREALEQALRSYDGTVLVCSHDRYLLDAITDEILEIKSGEWSHYLGNYSSYREKTQPQGATPAPQATRKTAPVAQARRQDSPLRAKERMLKDLSKRQKELEAAVEATETRMAEITAALADEETYRSGASGELSREYDELSLGLEALYSQWEQVCEETRETEAQVV
jgi:ATP-binding cassette subfamily F protein 3